MKKAWVAPRNGASFRCPRRPTLSAGRIKRPGTSAAAPSSRLVRISGGIRRKSTSRFSNGWFWSAKKRPRSGSQLVDIYYQSIGRNGNLLLNLSPDTRGLIPDNQLAPLNQMAQVVNDTFATNLAAGGKLTADNSNPAHSPTLAMDGNLDTWWEAAPGQTNATLTLTLHARSELRRGFLAGSGGSSRPADRILYGRCPERLGVDHRR